MFVLSRLFSTLVVMFRRFGGLGDQRRYNDTWSFDTLTRKWTELQCTGSIPSPRAGHAAVLVGDVMYVFGGLSTDEGQYLGHMGDLYALQLSSECFSVLNRCHGSHAKRSAAMVRVSQPGAKST
jgi:hypothetical protein